LIQDHDIFMVVLVVHINLHFNVGQCFLLQA